MKLIDPFPLLGDSGLRELRLSKSETATLRRASAIAAKARVILADELSVADEQGDADDLLAEVQHSCAQLAADGAVEIERGTS